MKGNRSLAYRAKLKEKYDDAATPEDDHRYQNKHLTTCISSIDPKFFFSLPSPAFRSADNLT